jgi:hypothetical protein
MMSVISSSNQTRSLWCILRTSGRRTLGLASSLSAVGIEAWTPKRTLKRPVPGRRPEKNGKRILMEVDAPIIPTFVFAPARHIHALASMANDPIGLHHGFSIFSHAGRIPLIGDREISGLKDEEQRAEKLINDLRECENREAQRQLRAAAMRTDRERRKAMRSELRDIAAGQHVTVQHMPSMSGLTGVVQASDGRSAVVTFNGLLTMTIEAWQLIPFDVQSENILLKDRAA